MNVFLKKSPGILLLFSITTVFGMQQQTNEQLFKGAGVFNTLPKDINHLLLAKLEPHHKNALRKTCTFFSKLLSFYNPSELIFHKDFYAAKKDISSIFAVAIFDKKLELVKRLCHRYGTQDHHYHCTERKRQFEEINTKKFICLDIQPELIISPYSIACHNNDTKMMKLLEQYPATYSSTGSSKNNVIQSNIMPKNINFLIACISRNTQRILREIKNIIRIDKTTINDETMIELSLSIIIANNDSSSLAAIIHDKTMNQYIKKHEIDFLNLAVFGQHDKVAETLITSKYFDFNSLEPIFSDEWGYSRLYRRSYLDFLTDCDANPKINPHIFHLLRQNRAKTGEELSITEKCLTQ